MTKLPKNLERMTVNNLETKLKILEGGKWLNLLIQLESFIINCTVDVISSVKSDEAPINEVLHSFLQLIASCGMVSLCGQLRWLIWDSFFLFALAIFSKRFLRNRWVDYLSFHEMHWIFDVFVTSLSILWSETKNNCFSWANFSKPIGWEWTQP